MTSDDLIRQLAKKEKISLPKAKKLVHAFIDSLEMALKKGDKVVFSNFGTFVVYRYPSKTIVDPQGRGHKVLMLPTNVVKWHPSGSVRQKMNKGSFLSSLFHHSNQTEATEKLKKQPINLPEIETIETTPTPVRGIQEIPIRKLEPIKPNNPTDLTAPEIADKTMTDKDIVDEPSVTKDFNLPVSSFSSNSDKLGETSPSMPANIVPPDPAINTAKVETPIKEQKTEGFDLENPDSGTNHPRISFEDFVKKSKEESFSTTDINPDLPEKVKLNKSESPELAGQRPRSSTLEQPFIGAVSIEFVDLSRIEIDKKVLTLIPEKFARQFQIVPISDDGLTLTVGMVDPEDLETIGLIKKQTGREVIPKLAVIADINRVLDQYSGVETEVTEAINASEEEKKEVIANKTDKSSTTEKIVEDAPVSRIVQSLIKRAVREQASDIHIEPSENGLEVRFRLDGILHKKVEIPKDIQASVISRVKILAGIKIDESRLPQDGRIQLLIDNRKVDFRVSTMPTAYGEKIVMRILDKSTGILSLEDLGLRGHGFDVVINGLSKSHGMTLVTGPTGSGKTTTLYAMIDRLLSVTVNIVTLEDPIEYQIPGINQSQVNAEIDYTFANGLRSILRQDPDVVMVGEIRDKETAEMAVNAALTGHIVLSTLHTNDAAGAGPRMIDMGVEPFLITSSLNTVVGQRLARKLCKNCQEEATISDAEMNEVKTEIAKMSENVRKKWQDKKLVFKKGKGCNECDNTGYKGRMGIFEVLDINDEIQTLLLARTTASKLAEAAIKNGMITMKQDGIDKALDGLTSLEEVWRVTKD